MFKLILIACAFASLSQAMSPLGQRPWQHLNAAIGFPTTSSEYGVNMCDVCHGTVTVYSDLLAKLEVMLMNAYKEAIRYNSQSEQELLTLIVREAYNYWTNQYLYKNETLLCDVVRACPAQTKPLLEFLQLPRPTTNVYCAPCQSDVTSYAALVKAMTDGGNPTIIDQIWKDSCNSNRVEPRNRKFCQDFVDAYGPTLTSVTVKYLNNPTIVCNAVGFCGNNLQQAPAAVDQCVSFVEQIDVLQAKYNVQPGVLTMSASACDMLPQSLSRPCKEHLGKPLRIIAEILENKLAYCEMAKSAMSKKSQLLTAVFNEAIGVAAQKIQATPPIQRSQVPPMSGIGNSTNWKFSGITWNFF